MELLLQSSIVRILHSNGKSAGTGFVIDGKGLVLTASHVVLPLEQQQAGESPPEEVRLEFMGQTQTALKRRIHTAQVLIECWLPFYQGDICLLQYRDSLPKGVEILPLGNSFHNPAIPDMLKFFGFPGDETGMIGEGRLLGRKLDNSLGFEVLQIDSRQIQRGFSGGPVLNLNTGNVIGFISWLESRNQAFAIPSELVRKVMPELTFKQAFPSLQTYAGGYREELNLEEFVGVNPHQLSDDTFIGKVKLATVQFLLGNPRLNTDQAKANLLWRLDLDQLLYKVNLRSPSAKVWYEILSFLQYGKIDSIVQLLEMALPANPAPEQRSALEELLLNWRVIGENPYRYIFEKYLRHIISNTKYTHLDRVYVELQGEKDIPKKTREDILTIDPIAVEVMSPDEYWEEFSGEDGEAPTGSPKKSESPRIDYILNIAKDEERFIITGAPGSGKSFTIQKILFMNSRNILEGEKNYKIPILIVANQFNSENSFESLLTKKLPEWPNPEVDKSRFLVLIDGINEINPSFQNRARKEIRQLLVDYEDTSFILSSRKYGFVNNYDLTVYELKDLQPDQVYEYIGAYRPQFKEEIWREINAPRNDKIQSLAFNPLTLFMIIFTFDAESETLLPSNRGGLFRKFISRILDWDEKKALTRSKISPKVKETLLSELALNMRKNDFNPPVIEVEKTFGKKLEDFQTAHFLIDDLCNNYILKLTNNIPKGEEESELLTLDAAQEEGTVSFMHESYLEYFCALEIKRYFLLENKLDIDFKATEWFETILMASDLFDSEANIQKFLIYLYYGGVPRKVKYRLVDLKVENGKKQAFVRLDFENMDNHFIFNDLDIACKVAYNVKDKFPKAFQLIEFLLLRDMKIWTHNHSLYLQQPGRFIPEILPMDILLKAVGGLSSTRVFNNIFKKDSWQVVWLIAYKNNSVKEKIVSRANDLIDNLSDFELLYEYLIENDFNVDFGEASINLVKNVLRNKIPLKLQKRLYERTRDLNLLERIGRQDPEYYIEHFDLSRHSISDFVEYLLSFAYNEKVQKKLLNILFDQKTQTDIQFAIFNSLIEKFYCIDQVLKFLSRNLQIVRDKVADMDSIRNFLIALPFDFLPANLKELFSITDAPSLEDYNNSLIEEKMGAVPSPLLLSDGKRSILGRLEHEVKEEFKMVYYVNLVFEKDTSIPERGALTSNGMEGSYIASKQSNSMKSLFLILPPESENFFNIISINDRIIINGEIERKVVGKAPRLFFHKTSSRVKSIQITLIDIDIPKTGTFQSEDRMLTAPYFNSVKRSKGWTIYFDSLGEFSAVDQLSPPNRLVVEDKIFKIEGFGTKDMVKKQIVETKFIRLSNQQEIDPDRWRVHSSSGIHPDFILRDPIIREEVEMNLGEPTILGLVKNLRLTHLFHDRLEKIDYGIVLKIFPSLNRVVFYSSYRKMLASTFVHPGVLQRLEENQIIVIEKGDAIFPVSSYDRDEHTGFVESFIIKIKSVDEKNQYLFIFNPEGKDFFLHFSRINFFPKLYDRVSFFPCQNYTRKYRRFPMARLVRKIGDGTEELKEKALSNNSQLIIKHRNSAAIEPRNLLHLKRLAKCYLFAEDYENCLLTSKKMIQLDPQNPAGFLFTGHSYMEMRDYKNALANYRKIQKKKGNDPFFLFKLAACYSELGRFDKAVDLLNAYFKDNEFSERNSFLLVSYLNLLLELESYAKAQRIILTVPEQFYPELSSIFGKLADELGKKAETLLQAYEYFEKAVLYDHSSKTLLRYSIFQYRLGEFDKSRKYLDSAIEADDNSQLIILDYAKGIARIDAVQFFDRFIHPELLLEKIEEAEFLLSSRRTIEAAKLLKGILSLAPDHPKAVECIQKFSNSSSSVTVENFLESIDFYEKALKESNNDALIRFEYAYSLYKKKQFRKALLLSEGLVKSRGRSLPEYHNLRGNIYKGWGFSKLRNENRRPWSHCKNAEKEYRLAIENTDNVTLKAKYMHNQLSLILDLNIREKFSVLDSLLQQIGTLNPSFRWLKAAKKRIKSLKKKELKI